MDPVVQQLGPSLLNGCCHEGERAERVGMGLEGLRNSLPEKFHPHLNGVIDEVHKSSRLLRDLADQSQVHISRVPIVMDYLNVILPCMCRTLRDITEYYEDRSHGKERRWRTMYHKMGEELPGTTLPARFMMYNQFLLCLQWLLIKSPNFDMNLLESLRTRILQLREARGIPPPSPIQRGSLTRRNSAMEYWEQETNSHWAESIFTQPLPTRTELERPRSLSQAYGPFQRLGHLKISSDVKTLIKRSFDSDRLSVTFFLQTYNEAPYLLIRYLQASQPWVTLHGAHELCIMQDKNSSLQLTRWSRTERRGKPWANLNFVTWEELILFYCTFVCLKARSVLTVDVNPDEFVLRKEKRLFQAQIIDDGFQHSLSIYQDPPTGRMRLHAAVWEGELRLCPVWTAFLPTLTNEKSWMFRKSKHRIWVRDIQPYVFCQKYRAHKQRRKGGAFEIYFVNENGAARFKDLFDPPPDATTVTLDSSDDPRPATPGGR